MPETVNDKTDISVISNGRQEDSDSQEEHEVLENLAGNFQHAGETDAALAEKRRKRIYRKIFIAVRYSLVVIVLLLSGYLVFTFSSLSGIKGILAAAIENFDNQIFLYMAGGFIAQMIDGALGMAYGVSVTTFLLNLGIPAITPAVASASMHASEIFTTGSSSIVYMRYKSVNKKLFRKLMWPGILGAVAGAVSISLISKNYFSVIKPVIAVYTFTLGLLIIIKATRVNSRKKKKIKHIQPLAAFGGFFDSVGGGGWGPIVTTSLIAGGRHLRYSIGASHLAKFFVALASTLTFFTVIGIEHWKIIFGLVIGGMIAAPISIYFSNKIPTKGGLILVGTLVMIVSLRIIIQALF